MSCLKYVLSLMQQKLIPGQNLMQAVLASCKISENSPSITIPIKILFTRKLPCTRTPNT